MNKHCAFTLIEIMIVMGIITLIAGNLTIPNFIRSRKTAEYSICAEQRRIIQEAEAVYYANKNYHSSGFQDLVDEGYLSRLLECPSGGVYTWAAYESDDPKYHTEIICSIHGTAEDTSDDSGSSGSSS